MKQIAVIPARSGSKGLKDKNIRLLGGKPLLAYTIEAAQQSGEFDCIHVSTDSEDYAQIAREYGADVPFLRDAALATDTAGTWDTVRAVTELYKELGQEFETVTLLQPTSPLRDAEDIRRAFAIFRKKNADSVISVCPTDHPLNICNYLGSDGCMDGFVDLTKTGRRQDAAVSYRLNGAIYIQTMELLAGGWNLYGARSYACIMSREHSVDIDTEMDLQIAGLYLPR